MERPQHGILAPQILLKDQLRQRFLQRERALFAGDGDLLLQVLQRVLSDMLPSPYPTIRSSAAGTRPPFFRGIKVCVRIAASAMAISARTECCRSCGKESAMRETVEAASVV